MIYFIRHAQSAFNFDATINLSLPGFSKKSSQYLSFKFDPKYCDCGLTSAGRLQSTKAKKYMESINVDLVIVSPLRRAIQTCDIIFNEHKSKPKILIQPSIRGQLSSSCDVGSRVNQSMKDFPYFDYSLIKDGHQFWYFDTIQDLGIREILFGRLQKELGKLGLSMKSERTQEISKMIGETCKLVMVKYLRENYVRTNRSTFSNYVAQKQLLKHYFVQNSNKTNPIIAVVAHQDNVLALTGIEAGNAEIVQMKIHDL